MEETGALPDADDVDMTDKFAPPSGKEDEMMLTCECEECGYTLFIAAGREGKFFGDSYKCPECGAPTRLGRRLLGDGRKVRICRKCDGVVDR